MLIIDTAALILFVQTLLRALVGFTVATDDALGAVGDIRKDKGMQRIGTVLENVVCITANDDTGALLRQLEDDAALNVPKEISSGQAVHHTGNTLGSECIGEQTAAGRMLAMLFHELGSEAGLQCDLVNQLLVIEGDTQPFCNHTANAAATGTEFTADSDDFLFHKSASFET